MEVNVCPFNEKHVVSSCSKAMDINKLKYAIADNNEDIVTAQLDYARTKLINYRAQIRSEVNKKR